MPIQRNNDEERAAVVDRLLQEHLRQQPRESARASQQKSDGSERVRPAERRRGRSDADLRTQREALERQWNEQHRRRKRRKAS